MGVYFTNTGPESYYFYTTHFYKKGVHHDDDDDDVHDCDDAAHGAHDDGALDDVCTCVLCYVQLLT